MSQASTHHVWVVFHVVLPDAVAVRAFARHALTSIAENLASFPGLPFPLADFENALSGSRIFCYSAHATCPYTQAAFRDGDCLLFGSESQGLPPGLLERHPGRVHGIPMPTGAVRSLNLATAVGIVLYEALRQVSAW